MKRMMTIILVLLVAYVVCIGGCSNTSQGQLSLEETEKQTTTPKPSHMDETDIEEVASVFPLPDRIMIYNYGQAYSINTQSQISECMNALNRNVLAESEYAAMDLTEQDITDLKSTVHCVELIYDRPVHSEEKSLDGVEKLLIQLSDNHDGYSGLMFSVKRGSFMSPRLAFDKAGITSITPYFQIPKPTNIQYGIHAFRSIKYRTDLRFVEAVIACRAKLEPHIRSHPDQYDAIFYETHGLDDGVLILAEFRGNGESHPELYYYEDGEILYSTVYSYAWGTNYTVFKDHTILFGLSELVLSNNTALKEDDTFNPYNITTEFNSGSKTAFVNNPEGAYILIHEGVERPASFSITNVEEKVLLSVKGLNQPSIEQAKIGPAALNYCPMTTPDAFYAKITIDVHGEEIPIPFGQMHLSPELPLSYLWIDWHGYVQADCQPGQGFRIFSDEEIYEYFWLNISHVTADSTVDDLLIQTERETPDTGGTYMLVFNTDKGYYTLTVKIQERQ